MGRNLCQVKESTKAQKRKLRQYREVTNDKLENSYYFVHETIIAQKYQQEMVAAQQKELTLISQELLDQPVQVEIQLSTMAFEQDVHNEVEEKKKNGEGKGFGTSRSIYSYT